MRHLGEEFQKRARNYRELRRLFCAKSSKLIATFVVSAALCCSSMAQSQDTITAQPQDAAAARSQDAATAQSPDAAAESQVRAVRLSSVEGGVQLLTGGDEQNGGQFVDAHQNAPVVEGSRLQTAEDGRAEIQFEDGSVARVTPNSSISLTQLRRNANGDTVSEIEVLSGLAYFEVNNRGGQYTVRFGPNVITPTEESSFRVNLDAYPAEVAVTRGTVHIEGGQEDASDVNTNETIRMEGADYGKLTIIESVVADSWDQWNSDRDKQLSYLESSQTAARASSVNPDDPGWNDLDYYGNWYDAPGYGMMWSPSGVGADFDPYGSGYWGYYQGIGYSWISSYPWGWTPFHCGRWFFIAGFGWSWMPSGFGYGFGGGGWYPFTPVYSPPSGYHVPQRPVPVRGRIPRQRALIPVGRVGTGTMDRWRTPGEPKPIARPMPINGVAVVPVTPVYHPRSTGPLGEGFNGQMRSGVVPANPRFENRGTQGLMPGGRMPVETPGGASRSVQTYHPAPAPSPRYSPPPSAPRYSPPPAPAAPHVSAPATSNGGGKPR
jgi:FecR protein